MQEAGALSDRVEVVCDGSVTDAVLIDPYTGVYVGQAMVVIPSHNLGLIERAREGRVHPMGTRPAARLGRPQSCRPRWRSRSTGCTSW